MLKVSFTDYIKYRVVLRGFDLNKIENILRYSQEKYFDIETQRKIIIGKHDNNLVMIPYEIEEENIILVTIHVTTCTGQVIPDTFIREFS